MKTSLLGCAFYSLFGCCTAADYPIGIPERPELVWLTPEEQAAIPADSLTKISGDYVRLQNHVILLEKFIQLHDDNL